MPFEEIKRNLNTAKMHYNNNAVDKCTGCLKQAREDANVRLGSSFDSERVTLKKAFEKMNLASASLTQYNGDVIANIDAALQILNNYIPLKSSPSVSRAISLRSELFYSDSSTFEPDSDEDLSADTEAPKTDALKLEKISNNHLALAAIKILFILEDISEDNLDEKILEDTSEDNLDEKIMVISGFIDQHKLSGLQPIIDMLYRITIEFDTETQAATIKSHCEEPLRQAIKNYICKPQEKNADLIQRWQQNKELEEVKTDIEALFKPVPTHPTQARYH